MLRFYCSFHSSKKDIIFLFHQVQAPANSHLYSFTILFNFDSNTAMEFQPNRNITKKQPYRICFVCLGNICRSPTAEGIFQQKVKECNLNSFFFIDSAGTSAYHVGEKANATSRRIAESHGVPLLSRARQFNSIDFYEFDLILAMDSSNYADIMKLKSGITNSQVEMMRQFKERYAKCIEENKQLAAKIRENEATALKLQGALEALEYYNPPQVDEVPPTETETETEGT